MAKPLSVNRYVGVELEVSEDRYMPELMPRKTGIWGKKRDGSVHNYGMEYVFNKKETGTTVIDGVNYLCDMFDRHPETDSIWRNHKSIVTENVNNGFHLHLDYSHKTPEDAIRLCDIAHSISKWMFESVADSRKDNVYCTNYDTSPSDMAKQILKESIRTTYASVCAEWDRYYWIHPKQMCYYGYKTVEVRLHHGTGNRNEILTWIEWWTTLANKVDKGKVKPCESVDDCRALLNSLCLSEQTYNRFVCSLNRIKENTMIT